MPWADETQLLPSSTKQEQSESIAFRINCLTHHTPQQPARKSAATAGAAITTTTAASAQGRGHRESSIGQSHKNSGRAGVATEKAPDAKIATEANDRYKILLLTETYTHDNMTIQSDSKAAQYDTSDTIAAGTLIYHDDLTNSTNQNSSKSRGQPTSSKFNHFLLVSTNPPTTSYTANMKADYDDDDGDDDDNDDDDDDDDDGDGDDNEYEGDDNDDAHDEDGDDNYDAVDDAHVVECVSDGDDDADDDER